MYSCLVVWHAYVYSLSLRLFHCLCEAFKSITHVACRWYLCSVPLDLPICWHASCQQWGPWCFWCDCITLQVSAGFSFWPSDTTAYFLIGCEFDGFGDTAASLCVCLCSHHSGDKNSKSMSRRISFKLKQYLATTVGAQASLLYLVLLMTSMILGDGVLTLAQSVLGAIYDLQVKTSVSQGDMPCRLWKRGIAAWCCDTRSYSIINAYWSMHISACICLVVHICEVSAQISCCMIFHQFCKWWLT